MAAGVIRWMLFGMLAGAFGVTATVLPGVVLSCGDNDQGQVGTFAPTGRITATQVPGAPAFVALAGGDGFSLGLTSSGEVWAWGANNWGQLGLGQTSATVGAPALISGLANVVAVAAGASHALALCGDGTVWVWGANDCGQFRYIGDVRTQ